MQNKSNTTDMQVKHFVKTIPDTLGFQADFTSAFEMLQAKMNLKFLWFKLMICSMHWKLASTFTPGRKKKYILDNRKDPLLCFLSFWNVCLTVFKKKLNIYTLLSISHTASTRIQAVFKDVSRPHHLFHFENKNQYTYKVTHKLELAHTMFVQCCLSEGTLCIFSSPLCLNCSHSKRLIRGH